MQVLRESPICRMDAVCTTRSCLDFGCARLSQRGEDEHTVEEGLSFGAYLRLRYKNSARQAADASPIPFSCPCSVWEMARQAAPGEIQRITKDLCLS